MFNFLKEKKYLFDKDQVITGERIQKLCDLMIGRLRDFRYNRQMINLTNKIVLDNFNFDIAIDGKNIFIYGDCADSLSKLKFKNKVNVYIHNSDRNIIEMEELRNHPNINKIYAQNLMIKQDNFFKL